MYSFIHLLHHITIPLLSTNTMKTSDIALAGLLKLLTLDISKLLLKKTELEKVQIYPHLGIF